MSVVSLSSSVSSTLDYNSKSKSLPYGLVNKKNSPLNEENIFLKEMLQQALSREAEALRKLKHLQLRYLDLLSRSNSPKTSPKGEKRNDIKTLLERPKDSLDQLTTRSTSPSPDNISGQIMSPQLIVELDADCSYLDFDLKTNRLEKLNGLSSLAPLPQGLKDVRYEREKPPFPRETKSPEISPKIIHTKTSEQPRRVSRLIKQRSHSDEEINKSPVGRTHSVPMEKMGTRPNSFWRRKSRNISDTINVSEHFDILFKHFMHTSYEQPDQLINYLDVHWSDICLDPQCSPEVYKYRDAVWEIFQQETKYLTRQLQPLEQVYKHFLEELQFHGMLSEASSEKIFGNISELIELTLSIAKDLLNLFERRSADNIAKPTELILAFRMFGHNFNPVYKCFCTNYEQQRSYVKSFETSLQYQEYLRVCRTAPSVQRSDINDLLIAPMQHQCHYKLLLENVLKRCSEPNHRSILSSAIKAFVVSLKELDSAIAAHKTSLELVDLRDSIYWPPVIQISSDAYVPQSLSDYTHLQTCTSVITSSDRNLRLRGNFKQLDSKGRPYMDIHLVLLNDLLLITEVKNHSNKKSYRYTLLQQPFDPNYISVHRPFDPLRPILVVLPHSVLGQLLSIYSLLSTSQEERDKWITSLLAAGAKFI